VTYQADPAGSGNSVLKGLVVVAIFLVAWWAIRGGYDQIVFVEPPVTTSTTSTTLVEG
jgi:hypothetical protein